MEETYLAMCGFIEALIELEKLDNMADKEFQWTDELIQEFFSYRGKSLIPSWNDMDDFKKLKQEQQSKRDWEILSWSYDNGVEIKELRVAQGLVGCKIYSVKRLFDSEIFAIGDEITGFSYTKPSRIDRIFVDGDSLLFENDRGFTNLLSAKKVEKPKPLLITEDGVEIFKGQTFYEVSLVDFNVLAESVLHEPPYDKYYKYFSTKEAAEEYILMNKPLLSLEDLLSVWDADDECFRQPDKNYYRDSPMFKSFEKLAKDKLNKK